MQDTESSLRRALRLLDTFTPERPEMSLRDLARRSGVPRSTTHRLVTDLVEWGAIERSASGLRLGVKLFELATRAPTQTTLRDASSPFLHSLSEINGLAANLAIRQGPDIVYLEKISTATLKVPHTRLGGRQHVHATALGKAILAFSPKPDWDDACAQPLASVTTKTITDASRLRAELARVRHQALAYDVEESRLGLFCVAAPILDRHGKAVAAVSVTGATALLRAQRFAPVVLGAARSISRQLSSLPNPPAA
jgi:IclR family acetate operon transcriptional repressor